MRVRWCTLLAAALSACGEGVRVGAPDRGPTPPRVVVDTSRGSDSVAFLLLGLSATELVALEARLPDESADLARLGLFSVSIDAPGAPPMLGRYAARDSALAFEPKYPLDRGRAYRVRARLTALPQPRADSLDVSIVSLPRMADAIGTRVADISIADTVPENLLRFYIEFTAPMSRVGALPYLTLTDASGKAVQSAFLPLDADFWNAERTRYTVFFDPGRVKQGIRPNEEIGRAIRAGGRYTLHVDSLWPDEHGAPLHASYSRTFYAGAPIDRALDIGAWTVVAPVAGTRDALTVTFPRALDRGLLTRALLVEGVDGARLTGETAIGQRERRWRFTPREPWKKGGHRLVALSMLEDVAGNRLSGPFEIDVFDRVDSTASAPRFARPFTVR